MFHLMQDGCPLRVSGYRVQYVMDDYPENIILNVGTYMPSISLDNQKIIKKLTVINSS